MKAIVDFADGSSSLAIVNLSYARGGVHYYNLTLNSLETFLDFSPGITKTFTNKEVVKLIYVMG